jgi:Family of unknown function (DUF6535)
MALVFSLMAALLALLIKQWVRDYMQVYQKYKDPLKIARIRQFLNEGWQRWNMPVLAGIGQQLLHISLFFFLWGLFVDVLNIDTLVSSCTGVLVTLCSLIYILVGCAPIIDPQSPYQAPFSGALWFYLHGFGGRQHHFSRDCYRSRRPVSSNMAVGQMELAMEETEGRKRRDERAIQWLVKGTTEDAEMDSLVQAIPNSLNMSWGLKIWKQVMHIHITKPPPSLPNNALPLPFKPNFPDAYPYSAITRPQEGDHIGCKLRIRVAHLLETCKTRSIFQDYDAWIRRTRACVETVVSLVCSADSYVELEWFGGDIVELLGDIGEVEDIRQSFMDGKDQSFIMRWSCLSLMAIRRKLKRDDEVRKQTDLAITLHADFAEGVSDSLPGQAQEGAQKIDESFKAVWRCLKTLYDELQDENLAQEQVTHILRDHGSEISELERIYTNADGLKQVDDGISKLQSCLSAVSHRIITQQLPGVQFDEFRIDTIPFSQTIEWLQNHCFHQSILLPGQNLKSFCSLVPTFRNILNGNWDTYKEVLKDLEAFAQVPTWDGNVFQRQLWRLQDLRDGGGLGFAVELFFVALKDQFSAARRDSWLYINTFKAITSDWRECKRCLGTQKLLLDIVTSSSASSMVYNIDHYPEYITDELLTLLENVLEQQTGEHHIDDAVQKLTSRHQLPTEPHTGREGFWDRALEVITRARTSTS